MATGLLVIRLSRPFTAKWAANWVMMRPKIRPKHMSAVSQRHVKNLLFMTQLAAVAPVWPINTHLCLCCEDVIKSKLVYAVLMRPKIRPKYMSAVSQRHVKNLLFMTQLAAVATGLAH